MSNKYPCVYYDNGKCQKFSDEKYTSWCDFDQCEFQTPSNGDRIRAMSDEELARFIVTQLPCGVCEWTDLMLKWLRKPAKEASE